jgi:hypothetical protein
MPKSRQTEITDYWMIDYGPVGRPHAAVEQPQIPCLGVVIQVANDLEMTLPAQIRNIVVRDIRDVDNLFEFFSDTLPAQAEFSNMTVKVRTLAAVEAFWWACILESIIPLLTPTSYRSMDRIPRLLLRLRSKPRHSLRMKREATLVIFLPTLRPCALWIVLLKTWCWIRTATRLWCSVPLASMIRMSSLEWSTRALQAFRLPTR